MSFTYNDEGIRTSKTVNGVTTNYYYQGSLLYAEETNSQIIVYFYDENGAPVGFMYRGADYGENVWDVYAYEKNIQGDIVAVYDAATGTKLISYYYNAWGDYWVTYHNNGYSTTATKNPYKYRGYYYDNNLGLYYLQTRYYDANTCRFINADGYISTGQGIIGYNMFAYCNNNPVMYVDYTGEFLLPVLIVCGIVAVVTAVGINKYKINKSEEIVANNTTPAMGEEFSNYDGEEEPTYGMTTDEKMGFIRKIRNDDSTIKSNWSEADMLREIEYHETGYRIVVFFGSDPDKEGSLADRLEHVNFEEKQNFTTYFRRFFGNLLPWGIN